MSLFDAFWYDGKRAAVVGGATVVTDAGYVSSGITESYPGATPVVGFLSGKF